MMNSGRAVLPHEDSGFFIADAGLETELIFLHGIDLPHFAAFDVLRRPEREVLKTYFEGFAGLAREAACGLVMESPTWRASPEWAGLLGYSARELAAANRAGMEMVASVRDSMRGHGRGVVASGCHGPRYDGYEVTRVMSAEEARGYHAPQGEALASGGADVLTGITMTTAEEAIGVARVAGGLGLPSVISFTVETDGRLPSGEGLGAAISRVDDATGGSPAYYMINCAHPSHFRGAIESGGGWTRRIGGVRVNASCKSHAELNESTTLDAGDPPMLAEHCAGLIDLLPNLNVMGGCCGTDIRHIRELVRVGLPAFETRRKVRPRGA